MKENIVILVSHSKIISKFNVIGKIWNKFFDPLLINQLLKTFQKYLKKHHREDVIIIPNAKQEDLETALMNRNCVGIALFGHGSRHCWIDSNKKVIYYCEFSGSEKKDYIWQFHCNHLGGKSLVDYLVEDKAKSFVSNNKLYFINTMLILNKACKTGEFTI